MPQEFKKYKNKQLDGRFKITPDKYTEVIALYKELKSSRKVAKIYNVDKKIILFIVNTNYKEQDRQRRINAKVWLKYYDKDKHSKAMQKYRTKKKKNRH